MTSTPARLPLHQPSTGVSEAAGLMRAAIVCSLMSIIVLCMTACSGSMNAAEKVMWSTYPLATRKGAATGFVINHRDSRTGGGLVPVVFTSAHLLETMGKGPLIIGVRTPGESSDCETALLVFVPSARTDRPRFYVRHPECDLVAFSLRLPEEFDACALMSSFLDERMLARNGRQLRTGVEVSFFGYPEVIPGTDGGFPVLRSGRVASHPVGTAQAHGQFLINSDVYPGDSGAPVMISKRGSQPEIVGMIIQRIGPEAQNFAHFAIAVDADAIRKTLQLLELHEAGASHEQKTVSAKHGKSEAKVLSSVGGGKP